MHTYFTTVVTKSMKETKEFHRRIQENTNLLQCLSQTLHMQYTFSEAALFHRAAGGRPATEGQSWGAHQPPTGSHTLTPNKQSRVISQPEAYGLSEDPDGT